LDVAPVTTSKPFRLVLRHACQAKAEGMGIVDSLLLGFLVARQHGCPF
jgi:hypothetical protein